MVFVSIMASETISISKEEYEKLIRFKQMAEGSGKKRFSFKEVFGLGTGKLRAQDVKNMLRSEW